MQKYIKTHLFFLAVLVLIILFTFWDLPQTFYQQDEWQALGHNLVQGIKNITRYASPLQIFLGEGRVLARLINLIFFGAIKFTVAPIAIFAILMHVFNTFLVFHLTNKLTSKKIIAFLASLLFAINGVSYQSVTWAAAVNTLPATALILLSIITYLKFFENEEKKWIFFSFFIIILSLTFKESGISLFLFLPLIFLLFDKRPTLVRILKTHLLLIAYGAGAILFRISELFLTTDKKVGFLATGSSGFIDKLILRLILYPLTGFFQVFFPVLPVYNFAKKITQIQYSFLTTTAVSDLAFQSVVADMISIFGTFVIVMILWLVYKIERKNNIKFLLFSVFLIFLSFMPYAVLDRSGSYMDSRYYYLAAVGGGMLFGYIMYFLFQKNAATRIAGLFLAGFLIFSHVSSIKKEIKNQLELGIQRKAILKTIKETHPDLEDKNIFYITGNRDFYIQNNKLPLQQGIGYTLMVWYYDTGKIPSSLLEEDFLWNMGEEGYRSVNGRAFGFFSNFSELKKIYRKYKLSPENVISFYWNDDESELTDISVEIRNKLDDDEK